MSNLFQSRFDLFGATTIVIGEEALELNIPSYRIDQAKKAKPESAAE